MCRSALVALLSVLGVSIAAATGVADASGSTANADHCEAVRGYEHPSLEFRYGVMDETVLLLAPRQARFAEAARRSATNGAEAQYWSRFETAQRAGVALLREVGLTDKELDALAGHEFADSTGSSGIDGSVVEVVGRDIDARLGNAPSQFSKELKRRLSGSLSNRVRTAIQRVAEQCGVIPDSAVECDRLLTATDAARVVGNVTKPSTAGECLWQGPTGAAGSPQLVVRVYQTADTFDWYATVERLAPRRTPVGGIGEEAAWTELSPIGTSCSKTRTLIVRLEDRTVVVGVCDGTGSEDEAGLLSVARAAVDHLV